MTIGELRPSYVVRDNDHTNRGLRLVFSPDGTCIDIVNGTDVIQRIGVDGARELATCLMAMCEEAR